LNIVEQGVDEVENFTVDSQKGKSKGKLKKGQKRKISKIDESSQFDWTREIGEQEILIHDSNRFNQDVNLLIKDADTHLDDKSQFVKADSLASTPQDVSTSVEPMDISELGPLSQLPVESDDQTSTMDPKLHQEFVNVSTNHKKLRSTLNKYLKDKKLIFPNKSKLVDLLKRYDESVETYIEDKELELNKIRKDILRRESQLKIQEQEVRDMHSYIKDLDYKLKQREDKLNATFKQNVEKELIRRLKDEKGTLRDELKVTAALNANLKNKMKILEDDRIRFEKEHKRISESERKKLNELQLIYEKKIRDADAEKKEFEQKKLAFEERRRDSLELLRIADSLSKELRDVKQMKEFVDKNKTQISRELGEDKELKYAIDRAQSTLIKERENLDNTIFSKYLDNKLTSIKPEYLEKKQDWKAELLSNPLYERIAHCRELLEQHDIDGAKSLYNNIRKDYAEVHASQREKEALYTSIRELYNEIQLHIVDSQLHN